MSIVRIDPEGRRNAEHIAIIVVVDLVPIHCHFRSRRPQAQHTCGGLRHVSGGASTFTVPPRLSDTRLSSRVLTT